MLYVQEAGQTRKRFLSLEQGDLYLSARATACSWWILGKSLLLLTALKQTNSTSSLTAASVTTLFPVPSDLGRVISTSSSFHYLCLYLVFPHSRKGLRNLIKEEGKRGRIKIYDRKTLKHAPQVSACSLEIGSLLVPELSSGQTESRHLKGKALSPQSFWRKKKKKKKSDFFLLLRTNRDFFLGP